MDEVAKSVEDYLNSVDYRVNAGYVPSDFAFEFVNFIKLVNGGESENKTPLVHYRMLDNFVTDNGKDTINMCHRGIAKSTLKEYLILYLSVYGSLPGFGKVPYALYVSDSIDNGVKRMRKALEFRWNNSNFLKKYVPEIKFTDIRWEFINASGKSFVVSGHGAKTGVRGPLSLDSVVYTNTGTKTIAEVQVGDKVFTPKGTETTVIGKSEVFVNGEMYKLTFDDGRELKCDGTHLHPLYVRKVKYVGKKQVGYYEKQLFTTNELLQGKPLICGTLRRYFTQAVGPVEYTEKVLPIAPYLLGLLLGDGYAPEGKSARLSGIAEDVSEYLTQVNISDVKEVEYLERSGLPMKRATFYNTSPALKELGLSGCVDFQKFIPAIYQRGSVQQRRDLLAGLLDTDGTCSKDEGNVSYSTISKQLADDITELGRSLGYLVRSSVIERDNRQIMYRVYFRGDINPFKLQRKRTLFRVPSRRSKRVALISITRIADEPCQCIRVEDVEHEFLTDNYLATHNTRENNSRPVLALLDDLISDEDARSATVISSIEDTVYKAIDYALHPKHRKIIWSGTPFNAKDPLYKAVESGAWNVNVYPVCEEFPCDRKEFRGSWEDRFDYDYVNRQYEKAVKAGKVDTFNQELMLRIMSDTDRMIQDGDIGWYKIDSVLKNKSRFNFYITTDFATSVQERSDYSVISVWAYNNIGDWLWVDGICARQLMNKNMDDLFRLAQIYRPQSVGIEVSGQQGGFIPWIQSQMLERNIYFPLASDSNNNAPGIRPNTNKMVRFNTVLPLFKARKIYFPIEKKTGSVLSEAMNEITLVAVGGFKSKHDDFLDTVSMLSLLQPWKPSEEATMQQKDDGMWETIENTVEVDRRSSYII